MRFETLKKLYSQMANNYTAIAGLTIQQIYKMLGNPAWNAIAFIIKFYEEARNHNKFDVLLVKMLCSTYPSCGPPFFDGWLGCFG